MPQSEMLAYIGAATGIIGAITGIAGSVMGYIGYRRSERLKALDLRLELRKAEILVCRLIGDLPSLLETAKESRQAILAATGLLRSSNMTVWLADWETDSSIVKGLGVELPQTDIEYAHLKSTELETKLIMVHDLELRAHKIQEKYKVSLSSDDKNREQLHADQRAAMQARLGQRS